jgi:hypothetical protein
MRRAWLIAAVLLLGALVGPAQAQTQTSIGVSFGFGSGKLISQLIVPAQAQGELVVSFHGDPATGCAAIGVCAYSGTVVVRPRGVGLSVLTVRRHGRIVHPVEFLFGAGQSGYMTYARVQRSVPGGPAGTCADASGALLSGGSSAVVRGQAVSIGLLRRGGTVLQTRCAGPLDGDVAGASQTVTIPLSRLRHGRTVLDLSGNGAFASHGFAGTVSSTVTVKLGRPQMAGSTNPVFPPGIKVRRRRIVTEHLSLVRFRGGLSLAVRGSADPTVCGLLDTCGLSGRLSLQPPAHAVSAEVIATGPASRPYRDFLTALGVSRTGRAHGISVALLVYFTGGVRADISQTGATCTDSASTAAVGVFLEPGSTGLFGGFAGSWRTRCAGPLVGSGAAGLSVSLAKGALQHREFTIKARASGTLNDDGYVMVPHGHVSVLLRRGPVTQQVFPEPTG